MQARNRIPFGAMPDGTQVEELILQGGALQCRIITYGGAVRALTVPGRDGPVDVALGFDRLEDYRVQDKFMGALVGRYANRIGGARFSLDGREYRLAANDGPNHLHGGKAGFDKRVWTVEDQTENAAVLSLFSPDGEEGYPGSLHVQVTYTLRDGALEIGYEARSGAATVCSLTNHTYFNLSGHASGSTGEQEIQLMARQYTPTAAGSIPTGELAPVEGTPMDLRLPTPMGARADEPFEQLELAGGYDHNWVIDGWDGSLRPAARVWARDTGIAMETLTTLPGLQFYGGNYLENCPAGKGGARYGKRCGFCLETQLFPDSPNHPNFPSPVLRAGETARSRTVYRFSLDER